MYAPEGSTIIGAFVNLMLMIIQIIFIVLKLTGQLDWSWCWILSPWVLPTGLLLSLVILGFVILFIAHLIGKLFGYEVLEG